MLAKVKNSRMAVLAIVFALVLIASGTTYAWFTATSTPETSNAELGDLAIQGSFVADTEDVLFEPGLSVDLDGAVKNTGSLPFIAKVSMNATSTLIRDASGNLLPNGQTRTFVNDKNVAVAFDPETLSSKIYDDGKVHIWMKDAQDNYYLIVDPSIEVDVDFVALLDGNKMGNSYMGSSIAFENSWFATQALDGAIQNAWSVSYDDLEMIPVASSISTFSRSSFDANEYLQNYLDELFAR
ncbi:hypothetical protein U6B65_00920 [Oscillospiraceae bacterium MB08-C2-2]|nr:hypothetical protein U6B65_00920 [Oscillospiraceae bacterium MB08-C2-2]